jgi:predicted MFS family arabinose efflux permease
VYSATRDPLDLAWVGLAQFLPVFCFALPAGQLADRYDRRSLLAACYLLQAGASATFAGLAATDGLTPATVFAVGLVMGTARAFGNPAGQALLPSLVPPASVSAAVAASASLWQLATLIGPSLGGAIIAWGGGADVALASACALQCLAAGLTTALPRLRVSSAPITRESLLAGVRYVRDNEVVLACTTLDLFAVLLGGATALLPIFAEEILHVGPTGYGILRASPALGATAMAAWLAWRPIARRAGPILLAAVAVFGLATLLFGLSTSFAVSIGALVALGAADMISVVIRQTLVQVQTPDAMRGRVSAVNQVFIGASNELGEFESGITARAWGPVPAVVVGGLGTLAVVGLWAWRFEALRTADRLTTDADT